MAFAQGEDGTRLHYDVFGKADGPPVLLIQGLGADRRGWILQRRALGARYRCYAVDNRGVGKSDKPPGPYDLAMMARDAVAVLDHAEVDRAHVIGASMGGVISQILGVLHADRVESLVLACTACRQLPWRRELLAEWAEQAETEGMGAFVQRNARWLFGPRSFRRLQPFIGPVGGLALNASPHAFLAQVQAILDADESLRGELRTITAPTLVLVGSQDILTPRGDSEELAAAIPGARMAVVRGAAHGFMFEHAGTFNRLVLEFLADVGEAATTPLGTSRVA
jgi:3-oxoadipate enol-lactonase